MGTKVRDVMTHRPRCVSSDTVVTRAAELMKSEDIGGIPVLDGDQLIGMVTDRDIVIRAVALGKDPRGMPVREVVSTDVVAIGQDEDLSDALQLMAQHKVRRLPVVDDEEHLVGLLAQADVARGAKEKTVGEVVAAISTPEEGPRSA